MTGAELEKAHTLAHYTDVNGQAQADRRETERRTGSTWPEKADSPGRRRSTDRRTIGLHDRREGASPVCDCGRPMVCIMGHGWACGSLFGNADWPHGSAGD